MTVATIESADVAVRAPSGALAVSETQTAWTSQQRAALDQLGLAGADDGNLAVFLHQSQRAGLDPFAKQIYMIGRNSKESTRNPDGSWSERWVTKYTIQTGINGYRAIARRAARRDGSSYTYGGSTRAEPATEWCDRDGAWRDAWVKETPPAAARFTITKTDFSGRVERFTATCRLGAYIQTNKQGNPTGRWAYAADQMLAKCAEVLALQMAYPQDYSGIEYEGAMSHLDSEPRAVGGPPSARDRTAAATAPGAAALMTAAPPEPDDGWVAGLHAEIRNAGVDQWRALNERVARAERDGLDGAAVHVLREALRTRLGELPASQRDLKRMHAALTALGLDDDQRKQAAGNVVGRAITSTSELTGKEAADVWRSAAKAAQDGGSASLLYPPELDDLNRDPDTGEIIPDDAGVFPSEAESTADPAVGGAR